jgi:hypothetical protein
MEPANQTFHFGRQAQRPGAMRLSVSGRQAQIPVTSGLSASGRQAQIPVTSGLSASRRQAQRANAKRFSATHRQASGASLGLVAAAALLIVVAIVAGFKLMVYLGSSQELRNSVDAAALNVSKRAVENKVPCGMGTGYDDVADTTGNVGLTNINRVIGKAYLINANEEQMKMTGSDGGQGAANAMQSYGQAEHILGGLYSILTSKDAADVHFKQISQGKPAKLLGEAGTISTNKNSDWAVAWVYRGEESNLQVDKLALPQNANPNLIQMKDSSYYMQGFNPMKANNENFCFTTFHVGEAPHLISNGFFGQWQTPVANAINPIPNAFKEAGNIDGSQLAITATACAVANPMRKYNMTIPHSYVTISIENIAKWYVQGGLYAITPYTFETGKVWQVKSYKIQKPGKGLLNGYGTLGLEYQPPTLWHAMHDALPGDHTVVVNTLLQRIREFCPGYTAQNLQQLLQSVPLTAGNNSWFIFPTYTQPDLTDPTVTVQPALGALPGWINKTGPEGIGHTIMTETAHDFPNTCYSNITGGPYPTDKHWTDELGTITWTPGTGAAQNLGSLNIMRVTTVTFTALP